MLRLYRLLLFLYPADYRVIFAEEMTKVFEDARDAAWNRGAWARVAFCLRELAGLVWAASYAHMRIHSGWVDRMKAFTRSRAAVPRLIFGFAAVVATIEILKSFVPPRHASQWVLWNEFLLAILAGLTLALGGAVGWAIVFVFGCTGMQRISNISMRSPRK